MSIHQSDVYIREAIINGLDDIKKNIWLIDDILGDFSSNVYLKPKYAKQIDACKEWFLNNQIEIVMSMRADIDRLPCVSISLGASSEKPDMKTLADSSTDKIVLLPNTIGKPIPYVVKPFAVTAYDVGTGYASVNLTANDFTGVSAGMILVNSVGQGYIIQGIGPLGINIGPGQSFVAGQYGIVPKYQYYEARIEHTYMQESYNIGCHAHGDPQVLLWLHSIVLYCLLRYREGLLEANGFSESVISSSDLQENDFYGTGSAEKAFSRYITLSGMVENTWVKSPRRFVESIGLQEVTPQGLTGGIKILSNGNGSDFLDITKENWYAVDDTNGQFDPNT